MSRRFFNEHPDIRFPLWLQRLGFRDESWKNDACARATLSLADGKILSVWVDCDNPELRETGGDYLTVQLFNSEEDFCTPDLADTLYSGDDIRAARAAIKALIDATV